MTPGFIGVGAGDWTDPLPAPTPAWDGVVFVAGWYGLYRSTDGGATWTQVFPGSTGGTTPTGAKVFDAVRAGAAMVVYYADHDGAGQVRLWKSTDSGDTWAQTAAPWGVSDYGINAVEAISPDVVLLANNNETFRKTTDGGASWSELTLPSLPTSFIACSPSKLWTFTGTSVGEGTSYALTRTDLAGGSAESLGAAGSSCQPSREDDSHALVWTAGGGDLLLIAGTTATVITPPGLTGDVDCAYTADGTTIVALDLGTTSGRILRSTDGGATWTTVHTDANLLPNYGAVYSIDKVAGQPRWYIAGGNGAAPANDGVVWRSTDDGATWTAAAVAAGELQLSQIHTPRLVGIDSGFDFSRAGWQFGWRADFGYAQSGSFANVWWVYHAVETVGWAGGFWGYASLAPDENGDFHPTGYASPAPAVTTPPPETP